MINHTFIDHKGDDMLTDRQKEIYDKYIEVGYNYNKVVKYFNIDHKAVAYCLFMCSTKEGLPLTPINTVNKKGSNVMEIQDKVTGIISDLHIPGHHENALEFCKDTFSDNKVKQVVCIGDIIDHHYISRHLSEPVAMNPLDEWGSTMNELNKWKKAFPNMVIAEGNHDKIPYRQAKTLGIPEKFLKTLHDMYKLPVGWMFTERMHIRERLIIEHGLGSNGMYGAKNTAKTLGVSYVQGHTHAHAAVFDIPRPFHNIQAMNVGCLIDTSKYNATYAKLYFKTPVSIGCGIIHSVDNLQYIPMM